MSDDYIDKMQHGNFLKTYNIDRAAPDCGDILQSKPQNLNFSANMLALFTESSAEPEQNDNSGEHGSTSTEQAPAFFICLSPGKGAIVVKDLLDKMNKHGHASKITACTPFELQAVEGEGSIRIIGHAVIDFYLLSSYYTNEPEKVCCKYSVMVTDSALDKSERPHGDNVQMWIGSDDGKFSPSLVDQKLWFCMSDEGVHVDIDRCTSMVDFEQRFVGARNYILGSEDATESQVDEDHARSSEVYDGSDTAPLLQPELSEMPKVDEDKVAAEIMRWEK